MFVKFVEGTKQNLAHIEYYANKARHRQQKSTYHTRAQLQQVKFLKETIEPTSTVYGQNEESRFC